ncbi:MAG: hypothetical protein P4N60_10970 [Verrucomicrobiae bacterium]|nr:hypothetical protein [Verrucomicrobiae bacterium]
MKSTIHLAQRPPRSFRFRLGDAAEMPAFFAEYLGRLSKTREDIKTWFEFGELDDHVSFGGKA